MGAHALGAAAYAVKAASLGASDEGGAELAWQLDHMTDPVSEALRQLPGLGENTSGPLGPGLLASGALGRAISAIQSAVRDA